MPAPTGNKPTMRAAICGDAKCRDRSMVEHVLTTLARQFGITSIAHGGRSGVDMLAEMWARAHNVGVRTFRPVAGGGYNSAGYVAVDHRMLREFLPDILIAFPGDDRSAALVARAREARVHVLEITPDGQVVTSPSLDAEAPAHA